MSTPVLSKLIVTLSKQQHAARKAQQQEQQQQLQVLLQQCGQEWLARSGSQGERLQAVDVATALRAAGLQELAAAVAQVRIAAEGVI
jgi:aspartokinase